MTHHFTSFLIRSDSFGCAATLVPRCVCTLARPMLCADYLRAPFGWCCDQLGTAGLKAQGRVHSEEGEAEQEVEVHVLRAAAGQAPARIL